MEFIEPKRTFYNVFLHNFRQSTLLFTSPNLFTVIGSNMALLVALLVVVSHITTSSVSIPQSIHLRLIVCLSIFTGEDQSCTCLSPNDLPSLNFRVYSALVLFSFHGVGRGISFFTFDLVLFTSLPFLVKFLRASPFFPCKFST